MLRAHVLWPRLRSTTRIRLPHAPQRQFGSFSVILPEEPFIYGVKHLQPRHVPAHITRPAYAGAPEQQRPPEDVGGKLQLGGDAERRLRAAARLARDVRVFAGSLVKPGITTNAIDARVHEYILAHSAYPSPLLYSGFPKSCCTSVNNIIAHGIPDDRPLEDGDLVSIDITVYLNGYHGDTAETFLVGDVDEPGRELARLSSAATEAGIRVCAPGRRFSDIGAAIYESVRHTEHSVSPQFTGHGIGTEFHRKPWIIHDRNGEPGIMEPGHCFTIEPCIVQGKEPTCWVWPDGWTASTEDCARSCQTEHMVLITTDGAEVLTR
ncbi:unnamed protein product [Mycena citricolor]|uniref:Methionine aminopeptidase n=1 Tax=Mycena citricolor TaxID=2018698 RepID=A0AAD2GYB4_9AGAR|nr:unnamed protein product [Mycena citricolor]